MAVVDISSFIRTTDRTAGANALAAGGTTTDASDGNSFTNDGKTIIIVGPQASGTMTVTITVPGAVDGQSVSPHVVTLAQDAVRAIGPFPVNIYGKTVNIVCSAAKPIVLISLGN